jgi:hypothetical protein
MTHVRTSPYDPQSNGKLERWHGTLKRDGLRPHVTLSNDEARRLVARFVTDYNHVRLHSAIGYVTPADKLGGRETANFAACEQRAMRRRQERGHAACATEHRERLAGAQGAGDEAPGLRERNKETAATAAPQLPGT